MTPQYGHVGTLPVMDGSDETFTFMLLRLHSAGAAAAGLDVWYAVILRGFPYYRSGRAETGSVCPVLLSRDITWEDD